MTDTYRIADKVIRISSLYKDVHDYCVDYRSDGKPDFEVITTENDILFEKEKSEKEALIENKKPVFYSDGYLEELAVYRKIAEKMIDYNIILFHSSVISVDGQAYAFTAKSGTGKSTHSRLWRELLGERAVMVNDDKPLIRIDDDGVFGYGTPYCGKHRWGNNICVPLRSIAVIHRSEINHIESTGVPKAFVTLLQQTYRPSDPVKMAKTLDLLTKMADRVKLYDLYCNMETDAAQTAYNAMKN